MSIIRKTLVPSLLGPNTICNGVCKMIHPKNDPGMCVCGGDILLQLVHVDQL